MAVQAYVLFKVNSGMEKEVSKSLAELGEVQVASITYGEYDVIAKITINDLHALEDFLSDKIRKVHINVHYDHCTRVQGKKAARAIITGSHDSFQISCAMLNAQLDVAA